MKCSDLNEDLALFKLLHIVSPSLPTGGFSYSQTLEWWVDNHVVHDEPSFVTWLSDMFLFSQYRCDLVFFRQAFEAIENNNITQFLDINNLFLSSRETSELRAETIQMGYSLLKLVPDITQMDVKKMGLDQHSLCYPMVWAFLSFHCQLSADIAQKGYLWSWLENLVMVGVKVIPLGQSAGQRILMKLMGLLIIQMNSHRDGRFEATPMTVLPGLAIASSCHESQYTRLFRS